MGYYTTYDLEIWEEKNKPVSYEVKKKLFKKLRNFSEDLKDCFYGQGKPSEKMTWYEHEDEMKKFSEKHPQYIFVLHGEGEEPSDLWNKYFQNGKMQVCEAIITYPDFDPAKLV